ncbi:MAG: hypothetical protein ACI9B2_000481, partial [Flavobacteriales bacterium]
LPQNRLDKPSLFPRGNDSAITIFFCFSDYLFFVSNVLIAS